MPADAEISIVDYSGEVQNVPATLEELVAAHEETPFTVWITLTDGDLTAVHQQFTP